MDDTKGEHTYKNFQEKTAGTSTPNNVTIHPRKSIHDHCSVSPIECPRNDGIRPKNNFNRKPEITLDSDHSDHLSSNEEADTTRTPSKSNLHQSSLDTTSSSHSKQIRSRTDTNTEYSSRHAFSERNLSVICCVIAILVALFVLSFSLMSPDDTNVKTVRTIEELKGYFPEQSADVWYALESAVDDVKYFNKPSVFLLLYENQTQETINHFLKIVAQYVACTLRENCKIEPIVVNRNILEKDNGVVDYGNVIQKYKSLLEEKTVMVVNNLDEIPGEVAQAFHSMCDEITPLVGRAVFFFTIRIDNMQESEKQDMRMVEDILRNSWRVLKDDIFYPLFARVSSTVLRIVREKTIINDVRFS